MDSYYKPIDFSVPEPTKVKSPLPQDEHLDITNITDRIQKELDALRGGTSSYHNGAVQLDEKKTPAMVMFNRLKEQPTRSNIKLFIRLVEQDISVRISEYFMSMFQSRYGSL